MPPANVPAINDATFPPTLAEVPADAQATERFGWVPGAGAVMLGSFLGIGIAVSRLTPGHPLETKLVALLAAGLAVLAAWEILRRRAPVTLVARKGQVGIYQRGALEAAVPVEQLTRVVGTFPRTVKLLAACLVFGTMGGILVLAEQTMAAVAMGGAVIGFAAVFAWSVVRTEIQLVRFKVPRDTLTEEILLERADVERLLGPRRAPSRESLG